MIQRIVSAALLVLATTLGVVWAQGQRPRPGEGREPEWPAPRITEYKPRSTLVVAQHPKPKAKYPVIDIHSHQPNPMSALVPGLSTAGFPD